MSHEGPERPQQNPSTPRGRLPGQDAGETEAAPRAAGLARTGHRTQGQLGEGVGRCSQTHPPSVGAYLHQSTQGQILLKTSAGILKGEPQT